MKRFKRTLGSREPRQLEEANGWKTANRTSNKTTGADVWVSLPSPPLQLAKKTQRYDATSNATTQTCKDPATRMHTSTSRMCICARQET